MKKQEIMSGLKLLDIRNNKNTFEVYKVVGAAHVLDEELCIYVDSPADIEMNDAEREAAEKAEEEKSKPKSNKIKP